jgi:uroporphyrinogen decarboxylase
MPNTSLLKTVLGGQHTERTPVWLMRQAGRYLPEYREIRATAGDFVDLVLSPDKASEVTLQPVRRFGMDAAIIFSDILMVPYALGSGLHFVEGEGPRLTPLTAGTDIPVFEEGGLNDILAPVYSAIEMSRDKLAEEGFHDTPVIGFAGGPWTVAAYMIEGGGSRDFFDFRLFVIENPAYFADLMDVLTQATITYLKAQIAAGARVIQLFESWAGLADSDMFSRYIINIHQRIVAEIKASYPDIPVIAFLRQAGTGYVAYSHSVNIDCLSLDTQTDMRWAIENLGHVPCLQGNLDPARLCAGGEQMIGICDTILDQVGARPFIFNLGHGVHKTTPPENVATLVDHLRASRYHQPVNISESI